MSEKRVYAIPPSLLLNIEGIPNEYPVALLLRHSVRDAIAAGEIGNDIPITEVGKNIAYQLGQILGARLKTLHSSPLLRCIQTAESVREGAGVYAGIYTHRFLGDPGVFVLDGELAWSNWEALGNEGVIRHLTWEDEALIGMEHPEKAVQKLLHYLLSTAGDTPGIHVFVTHDVILAPVVGRFLKQCRVVHEIYEEPAFLEGGLFWRSQTGTHITYRNKSDCIDSAY